MKNKYFSQIDYHTEINVTANNIFSALKKTIDKYKELEGEEILKDEKSGSSISIRIWQIYGDGV